MPATHKYGKDYRVKISDGNATPAYLTIAGETSVSRKSSTDKVDLSSKDDGFYKAVGSGQMEVSFSVSGHVKTPDAGFGRLQAVATTNPPEVNIQIVNIVANTIVYQGNVAIANFSYTATNNGPVEWSVEMYNADAPTVDTMNL